MRVCIPKENGQRFKTLLMSLSPTLTNIVLKFTQDGLHVSESNVAQTILISFFFEKEFFSQFDMEECDIIKIPLLTFNQILKHCDLKDDLIIEFDKNNRDVLGIAFDNCEFEIKLLYSDESSQVTIPDYNGVIFELNSNEFQKCVKRLFEFTEDVYIEKVKDKNQLLFSSLKSTSSDSNCKLNLVCNINENSNINSITKQKCISTKYMNIISKNYTFSPIIKIHFFNDFPLLFEYTYNNCYLRCYIMGKMEE